MKTVIQSLHGKENMEHSAIRLSKPISRLSELLLPTISASDELELVIRIDDENLNIRELSSYLSFIDSIYGRLTSRNFLRYSRNPHMQLSISRIRYGSLEVYIDKIITLAHPDSLKLLFLFYILRKLPDLAKSFGEGYKAYGEGAKFKSEARLMDEQRLDLVEKRAEQRSVREKRKLLREILKSDDSLIELDSETRAELARKLEQLASAAQRELPSAGRFANKHVKSVELKNRK